MGLRRLTSEWTGTDTLSHEVYLLLLPWDVAGGVVKAVAVRETVAIMLISSAAPIDAAAALPVGVEAGEGYVLYLQNLTSSGGGETTKWIRERARCVSLCSFLLFG